MACGNGRSSCHAHAPSTSPLNEICSSPEVCYDFFYLKGRKADRPMFYTRRGMWGWEHHVGLKTPGAPPLFPGRGMGRHERGERCMSRRAHRPTVAGDIGLLAPLPGEKQLRRWVLVLSRRNHGGRKAARRHGVPRSAGVRLTSDRLRSDTNDDARARSASNERLARCATWAARRSASATRAVAQPGSTAHLQL